MINEHDVYVNLLCSKSTFASFEHNICLKLLVINALLSHWGLVGSAKQMWCARPLCQK